MRMMMTLSSPIKFKDRVGAYYDDSIPTSYSTINRDLALVSTFRVSVVDVSVVPTPNDVNFLVEVVISLAASRLSDSFRFR